MGELVQAMLNVNGWRYAHLHGGVLSHKRGDLLQVVREDQACRVFLSTDAGGTGLNLQQASTVINLDMPWNPAVLEQRISRVYRLGQERAVRVINFIAEGTIEHGMLALHRFKRSTFSCILDGGENEVLMEGSRLSRLRLAGLLEAGISWFSEIRESLEPPAGRSTESGKTKPKSIKIETNPQTGQRMLHVPLPDEKTLAYLAETVSTFSAFLKRQNFLE